MNRVFLVPAGGTSTFCSVIMFGAAALPRRDFLVPARGTSTFCSVIMFGAAALPRRKPSVVQ